MYTSSTCSAYTFKVCLCVRWWDWDAGRHGSGRGWPKGSSVHHHRGQNGTTRRPAADTQWNMVGIHTHTHLYTQWVCSFLTLCVHLQLGAVLLLKCRCPRRPSAHFHRNWKMDCWFESILFCLTLESTSIRVTLRGKQTAFHSLMSKIKTLVNINIFFYLWIKLLEVEVL